MQSDPDQTMTVLVALTACIVKTLDERDPGVEKMFLGYLEKAYYVLRDGDGSNSGATVMLEGTRKFIEALS